MTRTAVDIGFGAATLDGIRRCVATTSRRWLLALTALLGLAAAVGVAATTGPSSRTFDYVSGPVQSLMSITLPFIGVLVAGDVRRGSARARLGPTVLAAALLAVAVGALGAVVSAVVVSIPSSAVGAWTDAGTVAVGGVLVQIVSQLVGTGLGLLIRRPGFAMAATIVLPLGLWFLLGSADVLQPARDWLTPFAAAQHLLTGKMDALAWTRWAVMAAVWALALNVVGAARLRRPA